ncbi:H-type lectin domain-containing protein [Paracoccus sp. p4-l81]|uniref:H-type lectin domain-containing protein n=1 Tax=unclassified Paracoccus (in: a-proteobacteria) TaxID=2688777 RepID=UPI0035B9FA7F
MLFSAFQDGGDMWTGHGPRVAHHQIRFPTPYVAPPVVHVSMSMWDIDQQSNQRADISAADITPEGFVIVFRTWGDTRVARVRADWLAIGPLAHDDDWEMV